MSHHKDHKDKDKKKKTLDSSYNFQETDNYHSHEYLINQGKDMASDLTQDQVSEYKVQDRNVFDILKVREQYLVKELIPVKYQRMSANPFSFYRGTADVMTHDLAANPSSNIWTIICGDAHLANFGFFASPERQLMFDVNDFDESRVSYWEYDLKRYLVSALLVAENLKFDPDKNDDFLKNIVDLYKNTLKNLADLPAMERLLFPNTVNNIESAFGSNMDSDSQKLLHKAVKKSKVSDTNKALTKYTKVNSDGKREFIENAPVTERISDDDYSKIISGYKEYVQSTRSDIRLFLSQFDVVDLIRHSVGVGSVGTLCYLLLLQNSDGSYLMLQIKEALPISNGKEVYAGKDSQAQNIINCQRILQSASDPFLGAFVTDTKNFYVRQFKDMKGSINLDKLDWDTYRGYVEVCIILLARAHSQSSSFPMIIGFLESHDWMNQAFLDYAKNYEKQVMFDYSVFVSKVGTDDTGSKEGKNG
jgi:Uncharacterized protein conserved in bacteria